MKCRKGLHTRRGKIFIWGMILAVCLSALQFASETVKADERVIKVGYDINSNFIHEMNKEYYGYGVEYLEKIAEYTKWDYEYVNYNSWQESLEKLKEGEIDLICTAHYTEERAENFLYSDIPLGYETTLLYANPDSKIFYQDYDAMNGCKVGLLNASYSAEDFMRYALQNGIECEPVYYDREDAMLDALNAGAIDLLAIGSRYGTTNLKLVDRLGANAFYCIVNKENVDLINEIEDVLQQIMFDDPAFEGELNEAYFGHNSISNTPLYTKEELEFIENLGTVKVKMLQNQHPSCYVEDGKTKGIWVEFLNLISEKSGIQFEMESGVLDNDSEETYNEFLENGYLLLRTQRAMEYGSEAQGIITSNSLSSVTISYFKLQEEFVQDEDEGYVIALTKDLSYLEPMLLEENSSYQFLYYEDTESCFEAVINREANILVQNSYRASYWMQKPEYADKLTEVPGTDHGNNVYFVGTEDQQMLINIINKAINHITQEEKEEIVTKELLQNPYPYEAEDMIYLYWKWMLLVAVVAFIGLTVYTILTRRMANLKIQKKEYELLQKQVQLDELTGLYNRTYFFEKAREKINNSNEEMYIVMMNISNFKIVNELYGMVAGDKVLKEIAEQILEQENTYKFIPARFTADYFFLCISKEEFEKMTLPKKIHTSLEDMDVKMVYGVFLVEEQKDLSVNVMCDRANLAAHDKGYAYSDYVHYYNDSQRQALMVEQEIENDMEQALEEKQFYIVVQPKYDVDNEKIVGGEALVRWQHPQKGIVSPGVFIKVFEKNGFIIQLDYYVWEETCLLLRKMKDEGVQTVPISINVSRAHFYGKELIPKLMELLEKYNLETSDLELEITESICGEDPDTIYEKIRQLQKLGFKIAMDDFGSGYSSLNMLKEMPLDIIKMDLKFLDGEEKKSRHILKALIELAYTMELKVVVEGVEILSQVEFLREFGGCIAQGYYFSRPVVSDVFEEMLKKNEVKICYNDKKIEIQDYYAIKK